MSTLEAAQNGQLELDAQNPSSSIAQKPAIVRSARACTVCRTAKMRCIGADDGAQQCQRCKRQNLECIFEKHRRGRKPGSKLSEHSKMLRRLEREMKAKAKEAGVAPPPKPKAAAAASAATTASSSTSAPPPIQTSYKQSVPASVPGAGPVAQSTQQPPHELVSSDLPHHSASSLNSGSSGMGSTPTQAYEMPFQVQYPSSDARQQQQQLNAALERHSSVLDRQGSVEHGAMERGDSMEESTPDADDAIYPARVVDKETKRHSTFFRTILNPPDSNPGNNHGEASKSDAERGVQVTLPPRPIVLDPNVQDPIAVGLLDEQEAKVLFDLVFMRLNGFINLFDPRLHTVPYVRSRSPFLFSCLIMAGCKFWKAELYRQCQQIAHSFAFKAFAEGWRSVEVVQAFACLTYWKEPDDTRTWTYIGYACRMAVELGLNTYVGRIEGESEEHKRERRNRERTYLVLWVHDRALSMQTGRNWMLPEDDMIRHAKSWHEDTPMRPEDVIVAAMVNLRQIAAETTDVYRMQKGGGLEGHYSDVNHEILLRGCNSKLTHWMDFWDTELKRANGLPFHYAFLAFFRLHVRLFLNSLGLQSSSTPLGRTSPSLQSLSICYTSAIQSLELITRSFAPWGLLRYGQDSMTVMSAYSAVFLIKLLRRTAMLSELATTASRDIHDLISQTADVYQEAALLAVSSSSAAYHARFLRALVAKDAESKIMRQVSQRNSGQSSRNSPDQMDEDTSPSRGTQSVYSPVHPHNGHSNQAGTSSQATSPQYATFPATAIPHSLPPPLAQMSPTETKPPLMYRPPPHHMHPQTNGATTPAYSHSHYGSVDYSHPHAVTAHHPPMVVPYAATVIPSQQTQTVTTIPSELDARYSRSILQELGYPAIGMEPAEWFTQAMGPSGCAGLI